MASEIQTGPQRSPIAVVIANGVGKSSIVPRNRTPQASKQTKRVKERTIESRSGSAIIVNVDAGVLTLVNVGQRLLRTVKSARSKFRRQMLYPTELRAQPFIHNHLRSTRTSSNSSRAGSRRESPPRLSAPMPARSERRLTIRPSFRCRANSRT